MNALGYGIIFGIVFCLVGILFIIVGFIQRRRTEDAQKWPDAPGVILSTEIREYQAEETRPGKPFLKYEPVVHYQYQVDGVEYTGNRMRFGSTQSDAATAQRRADAYHTGQPALVHYNPENPAESVLEVSVSASTLLLSLGIIFLALGIIICCLTAMSITFAKYR